MPPLAKKNDADASPLGYLDSLQHPLCGENTDDNVPGDRVDDFQRLSVDCGSMGLTCLWEVREDISD